MSYPSPELDWRQRLCFSSYFILAPRTIPDMQRYVERINEWVLICRVWGCGLLALGSLPMVFFPFYPSSDPVGSWPEKGQDLKAWFGSYGLLGKFCLSLPIVQASWPSLSQPASLGFSCLPGALPRNQRGRVVWGFLSGLCFQKEKPCWIANVILNSLDVRAELTESHCLCLKQIFIMWLKMFSVTLTYFY